MAITIPNTFVAGTKIEAAPVNANFAEVANAVDKRGDTLTGNLSANAGITVDGVDLSTIPNTAGTFNPLFPQVVIGTADTNGIRLDLESGTLAVREGDDSAYAPLIASVVNLPSGGSINFASGDVTLTHSTNTLTFGGASSGYIFNDGNVGIGVTPSASDIRHLQFGTNAVISGSGNSYLSNNAVYNGAWKYVASSIATMQYSMTSSGHQFDYAAAGTAGNTITFTTALAINTSGHLGIAAGKRFYLDGTAGTGDTYITEIVPNILDLYAGGHNFRLTSTDLTTYGDLLITAGKKFFTDGGGDTYFQEVSANELRIVAAGNERFRVVGANGVQITGALTVASGTPIYLDGSFAGDTYVFEPTGNSLALVAGGNERLRAVGSDGVKITGALTVPSGTPLYFDGSFSGDTYAFESSANVLELIVGGTSKIRAAQTGISVSTSATTIIANAGGLGSFVVVNGNDGSNRFCDLVLASTATAPTVVSSYTSLGSPAARTYTRSGDALQLAMASGTYAIHTVKLGS